MHGIDYWQDLIRDGSGLSHDEVVELLDDWGSVEENLNTCRIELEDANIAAAKPPEWGNCRRGCAPSYLDRDGFCSPACHVGAPRGEFITLLTKVA